MAFGRLERSRGADPISDINMTPLVDVMLVLVVIFILTAPLLSSAIRLDLPKADASTAGETSRFVALVVDKTGQAFLNDQKIDLPALAAQLGQIAVQHPDTEIQLRADAAVPYGKVVEVMGLAQKAGLGRIGFVAEPAVAGATP
jgi:biopolymer transport protein TolR